MTRNEARQQVLDLLGWNASPTVSLKVDAALRFVQNELESEATLPFFLRKVDDTLVTIAGENIIARPDDFIRLWDDDPFSLIFTNDTGGLANVPLEKGSQRSLRQKFNGNEFPMGYSEVGEEFQLYPVPTQVYPLIITYYARDRKLDTDIENLWLKYLPGLMIGRAGFIVSAGMHDAVAQPLFGAMAAAGTEKLAQMSTAQDEAGSRPVIGGDD